MRKRRVLKRRTYLDLEEALDFFADYALVPCHVAYRNYKANKGVVSTPYELDINVRHNEVAVKILKDIGKRETVLWLTGPVSDFDQEKSEYRQIRPHTVKYVEEEHDDHNEYFLLVHGKDKEICRIAGNRFSICGPDDDLRKKVSYQLSHLRTVISEVDPNSAVL